MQKFDDTTNETPEYAAFVDKFKPKKTTDDCYTPPNIYEAVRSWTVAEYHLEGREIIRPFWTGENYEAIEYKPGCVVIDNPPFSILSKICAFYDQRGVDYFLFAPALTLFSTNAGKCNYIVIGSSITYDNGAVINTGFVTSLGKWKIYVCPDLREVIQAEEKKNNAKGSPVPKYKYPDHIVTAATLGKIAAQHIPLRIYAEDTAFIRSMDAQKAQGKAIFGAGFLLSNKAAADKAAADKAAADKAAADKVTVNEWTLSDREKKVIARLGNRTTAAVQQAHGETEN